MTKDTETLILIILINVEVRDNSVSAFAHTYTRAVTADWPVPAVPGESDSEGQVRRSTE